MGKPFFRIASRNYEIYRRCRFCNRRERDIEEATLFFHAWPRISFRQISVVRILKPSLTDVIESAVNNVVNYEFSSSVGTHSWPKGNGYLADQLRRAIASVVLNISEGYGRGTLQERRRFFDIATGSAFEVASIFDIAIAQNFESFKRGQSIKSKMFLVVKMLSRI